MVAPDRWAELGITPTLDAAAIRRAYAARLKAVRPDADPQGFARLRAAYEAALADAAAPVPLLPMPSLPVCDPEPEPALVAEPALSAPDAALAALFQRGDLMATADALVAARTDGSLPLRSAIEWADRLGTLLAQDPDIPPLVLLEIATRLGWSNPSGADGPWGKALAARLDAERWFAQLQRRAASRWRWVGAANAIAARIMLGRGTLRMPGSMGRDPTLQRRYGEYLVHARQLPGRFDDARVAAVARLLTGISAQPPSRALLLLGVVIISWFVGYLAGQIDPSLYEPVTGAIALALCGLLTVRHWRDRLRRRKQPDDS